MKNIDKIRQMNSEELAELLNGDCKNYCNANNCGFNCYDEVRQWLEQEVERMSDGYI